MSKPISKRRVLAPSFVALLRIVLAFVAIGLLSLDAWAAAGGVVLTIVVIYMDSLDGYLARRLGVASELGALIDITADRIVEHVFWIYFAVVGLVPVWVPMVVVTRSFLVDTVRSVAFAGGQTPFGEKTMMKSRFTRFLVSSRFSRSVYGVSKVLVFIGLGTLIAARKLSAQGIGPVPEAVIGGIDVGTRALVIVTVGLNVVRGLPVLWDSRHLLVQKSFPRELRDER